jgi:hypothetical protein
MMILSKRPSRTALCTDSNGSDPPTSPSTGLRAARSSSGRRYPASSRLPFGRSHPAPAARTDTVRLSRAASRPQEDDAWPPSGWRRSKPERFSVIPSVPLSDRHRRSETPTLSDCPKHHKPHRRA